MRMVTEDEYVTKAQAELAARVELALVEAYYWHRRDRPRAEAALGQAKAALDDPGSGTGGLEADARSCLYARWIDQVAYPLNKPLDGGEPDHLGAIVLYEKIPAAVPPFARCRRENGLGWSRLQLGEVEIAEAHARASMAAAGDSGSLRMRAMALNLLAAACKAGGAQDRAESARRRARDIAQRLEDESLMFRFDRREGSRS